MALIWLCPSIIQPLLSCIFAGGLGFYQAQLSDLIQYPNIYVSLYCLVPYVYLYHGWFALFAGVVGFYQAQLSDLIQHPDLCIVLWHYVCIFYHAVTCIFCRSLRFLPGPAVRPHTVPRPPHRGVPELQGDWKRRPILPTGRAESCTYGSCIHTCKNS